MKKKTDYNFIIFLIIISIFGLGLIYLAYVSKHLIQERNALQTLTEQQNILYENMVDLYFSSIKSEIINMNTCPVKLKILKDSNSLELHKKIIVCFPGEIHDSSERKQFIYTLENIKDISERQVIVLLYPNITDEIRLLLQEYKFIAVPIPQQIPNIPEKSVFYLDDKLYVRACFKIENYTLHLFKKYLKLLYNTYPDLK